jgi:endonuclease YncB( thermonuclease family)
LARAIRASSRSMGHSARRLVPRQTRHRVAAAAAVVVLAMAGGHAFWPWHSLSRNGISLPALPFASAKHVEGRAFVLGPNLIRIGATTIRLAGIEVPERQQVCTLPGNRRWRCGDAAVAALVRVAGGRILACELRASDPDGVAAGTCHDKSADVAATLVKGGHVFAQSGFLSATYAREEADAKATKLGLWMGEAERPEAWRSRVWAEAKKRTTDGCPIKGQVAGNARLYVLPWSADYERVRVVPQRGGRWFCSEREAIDAGWKASVRG